MEKSRKQRFEEGNYLTTAEDLKYSGGGQYTMAEREWLADYINRLVEIGGDETKSEKELRKEMRALCLELEEFSRQRNKKMKENSKKLLERILNAQRG